MVTHYAVVEDESGYFPITFSKDGVSLDPDGIFLITM